MTDHEAAETLRAIQQWSLRHLDDGCLCEDCAANRKDVAALDVALQAIGIVGRLAKTDHPWEYRGGPTNERECCFFCGVERELIEHPNGRDHEDDCLWLAARAVCPGPPEER